MAIREIRKQGDEILSKNCRTVEKIDDRIIELGNDMLETMYKNDGIYRRRWKKGRTYIN